MGPGTTPADRQRFLGDAARIIAFEDAWLERVKAVRLALYEMPGALFDEALPEAGYWIARQTVTPVRLTVVDDVLAALAAAGAEVRVLQDFWPLCDAVAASSLQFSIIRKRNARPRDG